MSEATRTRYLLPPADAESSPGWDIPYAAEPEDGGGLTIRNHHERWRVKPEGLPNLLRACLDAYTDEPTGLSGREVLEGAVEDIEGIVRSQPSVYRELDTYAAALRRLLAEGE